MSGIRKHEPLFFSPDEKKIPNGTGMEPVPNDTTYNLTLYAKFDYQDPNTFLLFYYDPPGPWTRYSDDGPIDIRIPPGGCRVKLKLDQAKTVWTFRHPDPNKPPPAPNDSSSDAITVGTDDALPYYYNLYHRSPTEVWFDARYAPPNADGSARHHPFSLFVIVPQEVGVSPLKLKIDPDILNPGDHHLVGTHRMVRKL